MILHNTLWFFWTSAIYHALITSVSNYVNKSNIYIHRVGYTVGNTDFFFSNTSFVCFLHFLGSNGQDFPSRCHLERDACERRVEDLVVRYEGKCNPCQGFECSDPHQECHIDLSSRNPVCDCNTDCANETAPVCASNGKTVSSTKLQMASFLKEVKVKEIVLRKTVLPTMNHFRHNNGKKW